MAAYAAVVSLMNTLEQSMNRPRLSTSLDMYQIQSVREKLDFFLDFIESYSSHIGGMIKEAIEDLESQIATAAHAAEDVIESHIVDQIHAGSYKKSLTCLLRLQKVIVDMDSVKEKVMKFKEERRFKDQPQPTCSKPAASSRPLTTGKTSMVGFDDESLQLMDLLTSQQSGRQIISIEGMGGIGKTTLARNVYENTLITQHFDFRAWAAISKEYSEREILLELLCGGKSASGSVDDLGERLHKKLSGRRYLIVLDDMWSSEVWDKIRFFFPDNVNGSRIVVTTRTSNMVFHCISFSLVMNFLDENKSWKLFCEKAFGEEGCPPELEKIGKKIVKQCKGLPLSIVVIGGHLGKSSMTKEYWETVTNDIISIFSSEEDEQCLNILYLSYSYLPAHLKPCFLYMGIFPEDRGIHVSDLVKLWAADGFLKPNEAKTLEEVAETYLKDLVNRNLILVRKWSRNGKIKTCGIHDLLRELCLRVAEKEKFLCVISVPHNPRAINRERRIALYGSIIENDHLEAYQALESDSMVRSLFITFASVLCKSKLLRVLKGVGMGYYEELAHFQKANLRYLALPYCKRSFQHGLLSSISRLWNLQTLIFGDFYRANIMASYEIWEMQQLRHLKFSFVSLPDPLPVDQQDNFVLLNLQTLSGVLNFRLSEEVCKRIPNVKKLHIIYDDLRSEFEASSYYCPQNLGRFDELKSLTLEFYGKQNYRENRCCAFARNFTFPSSLQKLCLISSGLHWEDLTMIGRLPHLEVVKLIGNNNFDSIVGHQWDPVEGEFRRLKYLKIESCGDLTHWNADSSHFPVLEELTLISAFKLDEIPSSIGEIPMLRRIKLRECSVSAAVSTMRILVEQEEFGNEGIQLQVEFRDKKKEERFREMVQLECLTSKNIRLLQEDDDSF